MRETIDDRFSEWNLRLLRSFFSEASSGEEVFLRIDKDFLNQIGQDIGGDAGFLKAVKTGPSFGLLSCRFVERILELERLRKSKQSGYIDPGDLDSAYRGLNAPLYLPYLAALIRNSSESISGYYDRLAVDLELRDSFGSTEMAVLERVWKDLRKWTQECSGKFGFFCFRRLGGYKHIGVPASQSIVKNSDLEHLPQIFARLELRPGQDLNSKQILVILDEAKSSSDIFSSSFKYALNDNEFSQPIQEIIRVTFLDWDGEVHEQKECSRNANKAHSKNNRLAEIGISFSIDSQYPFKISPRWYLPPVKDHGIFSLAYFNVQWKGVFSGSQGVSSEPSPSNVQRLWQIISNAVDRAQQFELSFGGFDDTECSRTVLTLPMCRLWVLVPSIDALSGEIQLISTLLPASGPAYLLAPPQNASQLKKYLGKLSGNSEIIFAQGVPDGWVISCIKDCSRLSDEQRQLPNGSQGVNPKPHPIRFTGGRSVSRSYSRMYLSYDLPIIELDAPDGSNIVSSGGIELTELDDINSSKQLGGLLKPKKRYKIALASNHGYTCELQAINSDGILLGRRRLKIASLKGESVEFGKPFSLNNLGNTVNSYTGLLGYSIGEPSKSECLDDGSLSSFSINLDEIGSLYCTDSTPSDIYEEFLDRLAQSGSLDYGTARDLLRRLLQAHGLKIEPIYLLLKLRRLGHLELEKTTRGHTVRVYAIQPTLYSLPLNCMGKEVWGISGTLRLEHWRLISNERHAWSLHSLISNDDPFKQRRLVIHDNASAIISCEKIGFKFNKMPAFNIAEWSSDLEEFKKSCFLNTMEIIGNSADNSMRFHVSKGVFTLNPKGAFYDIWELWKVNDLDIRMENVHVLAKRSLYSFVRDSSWAKWLAINEFALKMSRDYPGLEEVYPPPIMYDIKGGKLFIPARIGLPSILEKAVISCTGCEPVVMSLKLFKDNSIIKDKIGLCNSLSNEFVLNVNSFYVDMAEGRWFVYHYVPAYIALLISKKLGAAIDFLN
jgi:hypothetical protein